MSASGHPRSLSLWCGDGALEYRCWPGWKWSPVPSQRCPEDIAVQSWEQVEAQAKQDVCTSAFNFWK